MTDVALGDLVTFSNGRSRPVPGTRYRTFGANGVIGTSGGFNAGPGSTIVGRVGSYCGAVHYSPDQCWVTDNAIIATARDGVNPRYVPYLLRRLGLNRYRMGSGQPLLTHAILNGLAVRRPTRAEQDAAASVLGALDDKIEVNGRIAAGGDALVRARYDEAAAASASAVPIGDLGDLVRGAVPPERIGRDDNYIALEHMPKRHMWLSTWTDASGVTSAKLRFAAGDVLFGRLRPAFHKAGLAFVDGVASTDVLVVRPKDAARRGWLLAALASDEVVAHACAVGDGTKMPRVKWQDIAAFTVPWPGDGAARSFGGFAAALARRVEAATAESAALADLRDTLLPELVP
ncbi:restriction endonuclease subunit S [Actinomadura verrucosospora]|uniref:restriction endonuclease subunit S n=1 Tax=Actinomadura TaxID=1988 RepID=UPI0031ECEC26